MKKANRFRTLLTIVISLATLLSMAVPALGTMAESGDNKIVINAPAGEPGEANRFVAYQIFKGEIDSQKNQLIVTGWGDGVEESKLMPALQSSPITVPGQDGLTTFGGQFMKAYVEYQLDYSSQLSVAEFVAQWLATVSKGKTGRTDVNLYADAFARIVAASLKETGKKESTSNVNENNVQWTIDVENPGYYLVKDTYKGTDSSVSSYILSVLGNEIINIKASIPTVDKGVVDDHGHMSDGAIDRPFEAITYTITGTIAKNIDEYTTYKYVFNDTLSKGLDLVNYDPDEAGKGKSDRVSAIAAAADGADVKASANIKIYLYNNSLTKPTDLKTVIDAVNGNKQGSKELQGGWTATYKTGDDGKKVLTVTIDDLKALAGADLKANSYVVVVYAAMMNKDAVVGSAGNPNDVTLTYSNDPYSEDTGETTGDEPKVYTVGFNLQKTDGSNDDKPLEGAAFKLKRWNWTEIPGETGNGEEWNKVDQEFKGKVEWAIVETVETDPAGGPGETPKYVIKGWTEDEQQATEMATGTGGKLQIVGIRGLGVQHVPGTDHVYKSNFALVESTVPNGYQKMEDIIFNVQITVGVDGQLKNATIKIHESNVHREDIKLWNLNGSLMNGENLATLQVRNFKSPVLPLTGGIGAKVVYLMSGLIVLAGVCIVLAARKKGRKDKG